MKESVPHNFPIETPLKKKLQTELGTLHFFDKLVVLEINSGITLSYKNGASLLAKGISVMGLKPFVLISNRINSYAVDPNDYTYLQKIPTLKGIAIVYHNETSKKNAELEKNFFQKPFKAFSCMEDAVVWSKSILET
ncbi:hypothetical protein ACFQO1_07110 [Jejudonia soesokkakensis]|uniref:STAS/SEC14 domain-containing protein n=1 Tax=Jejudonia soesokkakensis TaxID=1323432 RepID=A0ABW2MV68_9FLAO